MSSKDIARSLLKLRSLPGRVLVRLVIEDIGWERNGEVKAGLCVKLPCMREGLQVNQPQSFWDLGSDLSGAKDEVSYVKCGM